MTDVADTPIEEPKRRRRDLVTVLLVAVIVNWGAFAAVGVTTVRNSRAQVDRQHAADKAAADRDARAAAHEIAAAKALTVRIAAETKRQAKRETCLQVNSVKTGVITLWDGVVENAKRSTTATVESPTTTDDQKRAAIRNLASNLVTQQAIRSVFKLDASCTPKRSD